MDPIQRLRDRLSALVTENTEILAAIDDEAREPTAEEAEKVDANLEQIETVKADIARREKMAGLAQGTGRKTTAAAGKPDGEGRQSVPASARRDDPRGGFASFGEFAKLVRNACVGRSMDARLAAAATTYGSEDTGADGGHAVPPEFRRQIWEKVMGEENLITRCDQLETGSNNLTVPKDETTPWQTTGGIQVYWESEASAATQSKPALEMSTIRLNKLFALVPVSDELLEDAPGLESWLRAKAPKKMAAKINTAVIDGTGVGQPLGILRAPCTISVPKETSQAADTVLFANINKMWSRMYAPCRRNAVWLINQDIEPQLDAMAFDPDATSKVPVYLPPGGMSATPYASLKGRPVIPIEACKTLGDKGDINLVDLSQYMALQKAGQGIRTDVSMHLYFDQAVQAFRFIFRMNGQPWWGSAITPQNGNLTRSCFVTLDERS